MLPYICLFLAASLSGTLADYLIYTKKWQRNFVRKALTLVACGTQALTQFLFATVGDLSQGVVVALMCVGVGGSGFFFSGLLVCYAEMSPGGWEDVVVVDEVEVVAEHDPTGEEPERGPRHGSWQRPQQRRKKASYASLLLGIANTIACLTGVFGNLSVSFFHGDFDKVFGLAAAITSLGAIPFLIWGDAHDQKFGQAAVREVKA